MELGWGRRNIWGQEGWDGAGMGQEEHLGSEWTWMGQKGWDGAGGTFGAKEGRDGAGGPPGAKEAIFRVGGRRSPGSVGSW